MPLHLQHLAGCPRSQAMRGSSSSSMFGKLPMPFSVPAVVPKDSTSNSKLATPNGLVYTPPMGQTSKATSPGVMPDVQKGPPMFAQPDLSSASLTKGVSTSTDSFNEAAQASTGLAPVDALLRQGEELLRNVAATTVPPVQQVSNIQQVNRASNPGQQGNQPQDVQEVLRRGEELLRQVNTWQPLPSPGQASANGGCPAPGSIAASNPDAKMSVTVPLPSNRNEKASKKPDETIELLRRGEELLRQANSQVPPSGITSQTPGAVQESGRKGLLPEGLPVQSIPWKAAPQEPPKGKQ
mmetsp:Transcript_30115/g.58161  ORF Transcript_30115/g.58161 Transcript_30115/m.58161 type:complete len:296 (-) Transcript_30115:142-1029(-)